MAITYIESAEVGEKDKRCSFLLQEGIFSDIHVSFQADTNYPYIQAHFYLLKTEIYGFAPVLSHLRSEFGSQSSLIRGSLLRQEFIVHISIIIIQNKNSGISKHPIRKKLGSSLIGYMKEICCEVGANR